MCEQICHDAATVGGCEVLLEWMLQEHPGCFAGISPYCTAAAKGDRGTLEALRRLGVPWRPHGTVAAAMCDGAGWPALRWLVE